MCWTRRGAGNRPFVMSQSARVCDNTNGGLTEIIIPIQTRVKYNTGSFPEICLFSVNNNARLLRRWPRLKNKDQKNRYKSGTFSKTSAAEQPCKPGLLNIFHLFAFQ